MLVIIIILIPVTQSNNNSVSYDDISKISKFDNGSTVYAGDQVIDKNNVNKYPTVSNLGYLFGQIGSGDLITSFFSVATGAVPIPATDIVVGNVTDGGVVEDFDGPGHIEITNNTIKGIAPDDLIYGYLTPYYQAVKTSTGVDIVNNKTNQTVRHINGDDINNDTLDSDRVNTDQFLYWYNRAAEGSTYTMEYGLAGFSDNRSMITPEELKEQFPDAYNYAIHYPNDCAVIIYQNNIEEKLVSSTYTYLDSHPQYNDANREYNAKQFVTAWNGTVIPSDAYGCGREDVGFSAVPESEAESGMATHGVCPPARSLREAVMALGFSLPIGMDSGRDAVLYGYSPSTGIKIHNTLDYPMKIIMWTEGSGAGMEIHTEIYELIPKSAVNSTNSTNSTSNTTY